MRCIYVNGRYLPGAGAGVSVEDRGFQFADSVYEVIEIRGRALIDLTRHLARLARSLFELAIPSPMPDAGLKHVIAEVVRRNRVIDGIVYIQVSRGAAPRDFAYPTTGLKPTFVCLARSIPRIAIDARASAGISVITLPDPRWARCDLKTVMLLPSVMAKAAAKAQGATEAWFVDAAGFVTEGASSNAWIVTPTGALRTRPAGPDILAGVTRAGLVDVAQRLQLQCIQQPFTVVDAMAASEAFVTSASATVMPVVRIDGVMIGDGSPGPISRRLRAAFHERVETVRL